MKLKVAKEINHNEKLNKNLLNKIKSKQSNYDIDFFHNKLLNNIIELNNYDNNLILSNSRKEKNENFKINSPIRKINSAIMRNIKSQKNFFNNENSSSSRAIRSNNIFIKSKNESNILNSNDIKHKLQNKTINEDSRLLKSTVYNFPFNINSIKKKNSKIFQRMNKSQIKEDEKCSKMAKYVNILEKKMKEKLMKITNFDDVNCCYRRIKINNFPKNKTNDFQISNKIFFDINKIYKLNQIIKNDDQKNDVLIPNTNNKNQNSKNNSISKLSSSIESKSNNIYKLSQYIKEEVKKYFIKNKFSSIKDYFNDWICHKRKYDYKSGLFLDCDNIYYYLKLKLGLKITKDDIIKIFGCDKAYFDIENFKNFFFEENSGKKCFIITKDFLIKNSKLDFDNRNNKENFILSPSSSYFLKNKEKEFNFKYDLFFNTLKDQKSIILDKICDYRMGFNKIEYEYNDFYNLINSLKIDKRIYNKKIVKTIFLKYQNKNKKLNIKYFVNILYGNENARKEVSFDNKKLNRNKNRTKNIYDKYNFDSDKRHSIPKKKLNVNNRNTSLYINNNKKDFSQNINFQSINNNINKNSEESSDYNVIVIKPKKRFFNNKLEKNKRYKMKSLNRSFIQIINYNHSVGSEPYNRLVKHSEPRIMKRSKKRLFNFYDFNVKENSMSSLFTSNRDDTNREKEKKIIKNIKKFNFKNRKEKILKYKNSFKTISLNSKYKLNKDKEKEKIKETINNIKNNHYLTKRPLSSYLRRKKNEYKVKDNSNVMKFEMPKIFEEPRIQNLNSDIIDLI